jgi:hypothetical protein
VNACRHWIIRQYDRRFCCKLMILQWNKWAKFNTVMTCHLNFMALHTACSWYNIQSTPAMVNFKCPQNTSVNKCYKLLLHRHNSAQFSIVYGQAVETETYLQLAVTKSSRYIQSATNPDGVQIYYFRILGFRDVTWCWWVSGLRCFRGLYCLHLQVWSRPRW